MVIAEELKPYLKSREIRLEELAKRCALDPGELREMLDGERPMEVGQFQSVCSALGIREEVLLRQFQRGRNGEHGLRKMQGGAGGRALRKDAL